MDQYDIKCRVIEEELKTIWPQWHVIRRLGGGAFGDVFEIYRDNFGIREMSALKMIQINDAAETYALFSSAPGGAASRAQDGQMEIPEAFRNEIQIMEALRGAPNIVTIEDFHLKRDASSTMLFVRMELLTSFQQVMADRQREQSAFSIPEVLKIGRDICTALMYCETKKIIHRDIKPANLFMNSFGNFKVGDFGVSRRMDTVHVALTMTGIGTISYMAPEVYRGQSYNNTVDIYALGLILYQLLNYGRIPFLPQTGSFTGKDIDSANYRRLHGEPLPSLTGIRIGNRTVDASLDAMIRRACAVRSEDRYQSAESFYQDLTAWETQQGQTRDGDIMQIQPQSIPQQEQLPQKELRSQNADLPPDMELSQTTTFSIAKDIQNMEKAASRNNDRDAGEGIASGESASGSEHSRSPEQKDNEKVIRNEKKKGRPGPEQSRSLGQKDDERVSRNEKKKGKPGFPIPAILYLIALVSLICVFCITTNLDLSGNSSDSSVPDLKEDLSASSTETESQSSDSLEESSVNKGAKDTIADRWEEIIAAGEDGSYAEKYHIGDTIELDLGEEGVVRMELVAMDADELADGSGKAHMTWIAKDLLNTEHCMNENGTVQGGWPASDMRKWLHESVLPLIPEHVRFNIKEVIKYSTLYTNTAGEALVVNSIDKIWIPSNREVFEIDDLKDRDEYEDRGPEYNLAFPDEKSRERCITGASSASWWWLRSANNSNFFYYAISGGSNFSYYASTEGGVVVGFCL